MTDINNKISFDTADAVANVKALSEALGLYNKQVKKIPKAAGAQAGDKQAAAFTQSSNAAKKAAKDINSVGKQMKKTGKDTKKAAGDMILSWKSLIRIFAIQTIHQAVSKITSTIVSSSKAARDYSKSLAEIQTIGPGFKKSFSGLDKQIASFSSETGFSLDESTAGMYQTLSNQVASAGSEFTFMGDAADLAIAGVSGLDSAVNLLSSAINSYKLSSEEAGDISGSLFKTVELGRLRIDDIADSYGRVLGISSQMGISLDEVNASMATLTSTGMDANEGMTLITNTILKLAKPTKGLKSVFNELGVSSAEAGIQAYGFQGFLEKITEKGGATTTALGKLFGRVRAVRGALGLTNKQAERYASALLKIQNASKDTTLQAKKFIFDTNAKQLELEFNKISVAVTKFGQKLNTVLLKLINFSGGGVEAIYALVGAVAVGVAAFALLKIAAASATVAIISSFAGLTVASVGLGGTLAALAASPVGLALAAAAVAAAVIISYNHMAGAAERAANAQIVASDLAHKAELKNIKKLAKEKAKTQGAILAKAQQQLTARVKAEAEADEKIGMFQKSLQASIKDQMDENIKAFGDYTKSVEDNAKNATMAVYQLNQAMASVASQKEDFLFDRNQKRVNDPAKEVFARQKKSEELRSKARSSQKRGNTEEAKLYQERAMNEAKAALSVADNTGNRSLISRAEKNVTASYDNQNKLLKEQKSLTSALASKSSAKIKTNARDLTDLKTIASEYGKLKVTADMSASEKKAVEDKARNLSSLFDKTTKKIAKGGMVQGFDPLANLKIKEKFEEATNGAYDPLTLQNTTFEQAATATAKRIGEAYKKALKDTGGDIATKLFGEDKATVLSQKLLDLGVSAKEARQAFLDSKAAEGNVSRANQEIERDFAAVRGTFDPGGMHQAAEPFAQKTQADNLNAVATAIKRVQAAQKEGATTSAEYNRDMGALTTLAKEAPGKLFGLFGTDLGSRMKSVVENLKKTETLQDSIRDKSDLVEVGKGIDEKLKTVKIEGDASQLESTVNSAKQDVNSIQDKTVTMTAKYVTSGTKPAETVKNEYFGGTYRASGGSARGHDKYPAMLSRGEFVTNAGATRKMFSQLVGANASHRYLGGSTSETNNSNYTFNVNGSGSPQQTAREIQKLVKRENRIRK